MLNCSEMLSKALGLIRALFYRIRYGKNFHYAGLPFLKKGASVKLRSGGVIKLGTGFQANRNVYLVALNHGVLDVGDGVSINRNSMLVCHEGISLGDGVCIGPNCVIYDHDHCFGLHGVKNVYKTSPVVIEDNCWIGANVSILRGSHTSEGSVVGAGSVVKGYIPPHTIVTSDRSLRMRSIENRCNSFEASPLIEHA